jgi:hypothetical protein
MHQELGSLQQMPLLLIISLLLVAVVAAEEMRVVVAVQVDLEQEQVYL